MIVAECETKPPAREREVDTAEIARSQVAEITIAEKVVPSETECARAKAESTPLAGIRTSEEQARADDLETELRTFFQRQMKGVRLGIGLVVDVLNKLVELGALYAKAESRMFADWWARMVVAPRSLCQICVRTVLHHGETSVRTPSRLPAQVTRSL